MQQGDDASGNAWVCSRGFAMTRCRRRALRSPGREYASGKFQGLTQAKTPRRQSSSDCSTRPRSRQGHGTRELRPCAGRRNSADSRRLRALHLRRPAGTCRFARQQRYELVGIASMRSAARSEQVGTLVCGYCVPVAPGSMRPIQASCSPSARVHWTRPTVRRPSAGS